MKHTFKISIRLFAATAIMVLFMGLSVQQKKDTRPNIIFILADDMGYSDIGAYGGEVQTPNLDALAANGIKMRNFYNNARCCPTRASLLTGQYPHKVALGTWSPWRELHMNPAVTRDFLILPIQPLQRHSRKPGMEPICPANGMWVNAKNTGLSKEDLTGTSD